MPAGLCDICQQAARQLLTCSLCGRRVCPNCITVRGVCKDCLSGRKMSDVPPDIVDRML